MLCVCIDAYVNLKVARWPVDLRSDLGVVCSLQFSIEFYCSLSFESTPHTCLAFMYLCLLMKLEVQKLKLK